MLLSDHGGCSEERMLEHYRKKKIVSGGDVAEKNLSSCIIFLSYKGHFPEMWEGGGHAPIRLLRHHRSQLARLVKYVSKICGLNFEIIAVTRQCIGYFSFT